jgi:hypothetical protein
MHSLAGRLPGMRYRSLLLLPLLGLSCLGMGTKTLPFTIRFYTETSAQDSDSFSAQVTLLNGQLATIDGVAAISEKDVQAIYPVALPDGTAQCALFLDDHGTIALDSLSVAKRGTLLIATIDGQQVADIRIDQRVSDGIVTIPSGITTDEMKQMLKAYPVVGKKKLKRKDVYSAGL